MTPDALAAECDRILAADLRYVLLVMPRPWGRRPRMQLAGPGSPLGEVVGQQLRRDAAGRDLPVWAVCQFDARAVLAWLATRGERALAAARRRRRKRPA
jgi:hypothetical protein